MTEHKRPLILFSGGLDSTMLLYDALRQGPADILSVTSNIATEKAEAEAIRIQSQAVQAQGGASYIELKRIEKWDGRLPLVSSGNSGMMFQIPPGVIQK